MTPKIQGGFPPALLSLAVVCYAFAGILDAADTGSPSEQSAAEEILDASGVKGGLVVHLGCGDGKLTAALRANDSYLVQGLDTAAEKVEQARRLFSARGLGGKVTARRFDGKTLPYIDNTVNLVVAGAGCQVSGDEIIRVLAPKGVAYLRQGDAWTKTIKPWPKDIAEWTHYHYGPQGTMVGKDRVVGPPRRIQWVGGPKWLRNHDFMSSLHAMVSSGGRIFYIIDEGLRNHIFLPSRWTLIARDGFNGKILWKKAVKDWHPQNWPLKSGPGYLPRRLVAVGDKVYVTLGFNEPLTALDAATGETINTYEATKATEEIVAAGEALFLLVDPDKQPVGYRAKSASYGEIGHANRGWAWSKDGPPRSIVAVDAESGKVLWKHVVKVAPLTLTVGQQRVFFHNGDGMVALDRKTGKELWGSDGPGIKNVPTGGALRVVLSDGILVFAAGTKVSGFSAEDGRQLWAGSLLHTSHNCPNDLFIIDDLIWSANTGTPQRNGTHFKALDLRSGETSKDFVAQNLPAFPMHPRCYPGRATTRYLMTQGMGTEFYELGGEPKVDINHCVRGSCIYGVMPCNGLLYKPPDSCACYYQSKLEYFCALAPQGEGPRVKASAIRQRLEKGPAYGKIARGPAPNAQRSWPMYRHDTTRSGCSPAPVTADLKRSWTVKLGGKLTQPVAAGGKVLVAAVDQQTLYALDADSGQQLWRYTAGGRIDSPPTIYKGMVLFGAADGCVYCLRAEDGAPAWRYLVAPCEKQHVSYQQLESVWPVSGSVLVFDDVVYCLAGRNMFFDGGLRLVRLDPATGKMISETVMDQNDPRTGKNLQTLITAKYMPVANADLFSCDGDYLYMQAQKFDLEGKRLEIAPALRKAEARQDKGGRHLFCQTGFLDDLWFHRSYWIYGEDCGEGWGAYAGTRKNTPCGRIMVFDESRAYAFRSEPLGNMLHPRTRYRLYAAAKNAGAQAPPAVTGKKGRRGKPTGKRAGGLKTHWELESLPLLANAMVLGGKSLCIAGPPDLADETKMLGFLPGADDEINRQLEAQSEAWRGTRGGLLWVLSAEDGQKLAQYKLDSIPVFDGMAAANGRLLLAMKDGSVICFGETPK